MKNAEVNAKTPRCRYISKIGARCHGDVEAGKFYCFFHDPEQKNKQAQAQKEVQKEAQKKPPAVRLTQSPCLPVSPFSLSRLPPTSPNCWPKPSTNSAAER